MTQPGLIKEQKAKYKTVITLIDGKMKRSYSITKDHREYREIVLNKRINHWQKANKIIVEHEDFKKTIAALHRYNIKEPFATNIGMRIFMASWEVIQQTKS